MSAVAVEQGQLSTACYKLYSSSPPRSQLSLRQKDTHVEAIYYRTRLAFEAGESSPAMEMPYFS
jgi:hypothetical protein